MKKAVTLVGPRQVKTAQGYIAQPEYLGWVMTLSQPNRNSAQNALLHVLIDEVARQVEWAGKKRDAEIWKRLLVSAWCRVRGESVEILPAIDGHGVDIVPARTSKLSKAECADLITFIEAWAVENGVEFAEVAA
jgi:hypothetical protein